MNPIRVAQYLGKFVCLVVLKELSGEKCLDPNLLPLCSLDSDAGISGAIEIT